VSGNRVEVDYSDVQRAIPKLLAAIDGGARKGEAATAQRVATDLRSAIPKRTGRLARTIAVTSDGDGAAVHYGGALPYANYIDHRTGAVDQAVSGSDAAFGAAMTTAAQAAVRTI
jgi:hypothetical protein